MVLSTHTRLSVVGALFLFACDPGGGGMDAGASSDGAASDVGELDALVEDGGVPPVDAPLDGAMLEDTAAEDALCEPCESGDECVSFSGCSPSCALSYAADGTPCGEDGTCDGAGICSAPVTCGDGIRHRLGDAREGCDDGNAVGGDACSMVCVPTSFVVASTTGGTEFPPGPSIGVAVDGGGAALYVWTAALTTGGGAEVRARLYGALGAPGATIALASNLGVGVDPHPVVAGLEGGGWIVAWEDPAIDMSSIGIAYRLVRADGTVGTTRRANESRLLRQHEPAIATLGDGVVIAWTDESGLIDGSSASRVVFRTISATGAASSGEVPVAISTRDELGEPSIATRADGSVLVAWTDRGADPSFFRSVWGRRFMGTTPRDGGPFELSSGESHSPSVAALDVADFVVVWTTRASDGGGDIVARVVHGTGLPLVEPMVVVAQAVDMSSLPPEQLAETEPSVAGLPGGFITSWAVGREDTGVGISASITTAPPELADLAVILGEGTVGDVSVARGPTGIWVSYGIAEGAPVSGALRAVYGYLLPAD